MAKCKDCNVEMIDDALIHTDSVGGASIKEKIYITYKDDNKAEKGLLQKALLGNETTNQVKARVCPKCSKIELYANFDDEKFRLI